MGREVTGDFYHKFWFAIQESSDINEFGGQNNIDTYRHNWVKSDMPTVTKKLNKFEKQFETKFKIKVDTFLRKISNKGYQASTSDPETMTWRWEEMSKLAAKIELGRKIKKTLEKMDVVEVEYEV